MRDGAGGGCHPLKARQVELSYNRFFSSAGGAYPTDWNARFAVRAAGSDLAAAITRAIRSCVGLGVSSIYTISADQSGRQGTHAGL